MPKELKLDPVDEKLKQAVEEWYNAKQAGRKKKMPAATLLKILMMIWEFIISK